jgi:hypothetical protein
MKPARKKPPATTEVTMREFRVAPAKILRRAARTKTRVRVGEFVLAVEEAKAPQRHATLHGCMRDTGRIVGDPASLLSADDDWSTDA